jgi:hypothetical protein
MSGTSVKAPPFLERRSAEQSHGEKTLNDLFLTTLKDIYYAEKQILTTLHH